MCEPTTIIMVAGLVLGAYAQHENAEHMKDVARFNAREGENEAVRTRNQGHQEEVTHRQKVEQLRSEQRANFAANNVDLNTGSAADVIGDTELFGEVDSLRIRTNYQEQAAALERGSSLVRSQGDAASRAGKLQAGGTLLQGAGTVSSKWYNPDSSALTTTTTGAQANSRVGHIS